MFWLKILSELCLIFFKTNTNYIMFGVLYKFIDLTFYLFHCIYVNIWFFFYLPFWMYEKDAIHKTQFNNI